MRKMAPLSTSRTATRKRQLAATPAQLLDAAERLFAENGIDHVSTREIVRASGQSNLSAALYHFGTREAMVKALLERRLRTLNEMRHQRLDQLVASGRSDSIHAIVTTTVDVLAGAVESMAWGPDYVRVAAQVLFSPRAQGLFSRRTHGPSLVDRDVMSGNQRCAAMLRRLLPSLPSRVFEDRIIIMSTETIYSIAGWIQIHRQVTASNRRNFGALIRTTADFLAAGVAAPIGEPAGVKRR